MIQSSTSVPLQTGSAPEWLGHGYGMLVTRQRRNEGSVDVDVPESKKQPAAYVQEIDLNGLLVCDLDLFLNSACQPMLTILQQVFASPAVDDPLPIFRRFFKVLCSALTSKADV
jgi:hypothetical protein